MKKQRKLKGLRRFLTHGLITAAVLTALLLPLTASAETSTEQAVAQLEGRIEYVKRTIKEAERTPFVPALENELLHLYRELARIQPQENDPALLKSADERGKITGKVTDTAGKAIGENVQVCAYKIYPDGSRDWSRFVCTKANEAGKYILPEGVYTLAGLESGEYKLWFEHYPPYPTEAVPEPIKYQDQWYQDAPFSACAEPVTVAFGKTTENINVQLALRPTGKISGKVTPGDLQVEMGPNTSVYAYGDNGVWKRWYVHTDGTYTISELPTGNYTVHFKPPSWANYLEQYYKGTTDITSAKTVAVEDGKEATGIDAQLNKGGIISGTVTAKEDATKSLSWGEVIVYDSKGKSVKKTYTYDLNVYTIQGLAAGDYTLEFKNFWHWDSENEKHSSYTPKTIEVKGVTQGDTPKPQDVVLEQGGSISGIVKAKDSGKPVYNENWDSVTVYDKDNNQVYPNPNVNWSNLPEEGTTVGAMQFRKYTIQGLPAGDYTLKFKGFSNFRSNYGYGYRVWSDSCSEECTWEWICPEAEGEECTQEWICKDVDVCWQWQDEDYAHYAFASESVKVTVGAETPKDVALERGGSISGMVTDTATGAPLYASVIVSDKDGNAVGSAWAWWNAFYRIEGLAAGTYTVQADRSDYLSESRDGVVVRSNDDTPNINFALKEDDSRSRNISGRVTKDKKPYGCVSVSIYGAEDIYAANADLQDENNYTFVSRTNTNHKGEYVVYNATPSKSYKVAFERKHWGIFDQQWYSCKTDSDSAKVVHAGKSNVNACFTASGDFCGCGRGMMMQTIITPFLLNRSNK